MLPPLNHYKVSLISRSGSIFYENLREKQIEFPVELWQHLFGTTKMVGS